MVKRDRIVNFCDQLLDAKRIKDYCPNGLQVEGADEVKRIMTGVTACQALLDAAVEWQADMVLVHHGYFWKGEPAPVKGLKKRRLQTLLTHDISLLAYHLPLDLHNTLGNNVRLAEQLEIKVTGPLELDNPQSIGLVGELHPPMSVSQFSAHLTERLGRAPLHVGEGSDMIHTIGWCTGSAQGYIEHAIGQNLDAYLSGEISEPTTHTAREQGIHYFSAGHHATERYGVEALGQRLAEEFGIEHKFVDIDNPV